MNYIENLAQDIRNQLVRIIELDSDIADRIKLEIINYFISNPKQNEKINILKPEIITRCLSPQIFLPYAIKCYSSKSLILYSKENATFNETESKCSYDSWVVIFEEDKNIIAALICS